MNLDRLKIISAGAGSGKTYRLTQEMVALLTAGQVRPEGIVATTFTRKAATELQERVRVKLLQDGLTAEAEALDNALIGTVHGLGVKLLRRFAFEAGVSPQVDILPDDQQQLMFNQSLAAVLSLELMEEMDELIDRLGLNKRNSFFDWRGEVRRLADIARANDFSATDLQQSCQQSWQSFQAFLAEPNQQTLAEAEAGLAEALQQTADTLEQGEDSTKLTSEAIDKLRGFRRELRLRGRLHWHQWAAIGKVKVGAKSREVVADLKQLAAQHEALPAFQQDIQRFTNLIFETALAAIAEYDTYKKGRGLIDYTDMEVLVSHLLDNKPVQQVLATELDLLMVDEFQDTSPIQLEIFLKLAQLANHSVWVGDPKQSIYGFRGAEPRLMQAIIEAAGGIKAENIQLQSWRSRAGLVHVSNALFCKAFAHLPEEQVALQPVRVPEGNTFSPAEPISMDDSLIHWHFEAEGTTRVPGSPWMEDCLARSVKQWLEEQHLIQPKGTKDFQAALPGDVAILCRSNRACAKMAEALHRAGLKAAIARAGLLETAEAKLVLACLKYLLSQEDSLSVAEIQVLASRKPLVDIIEDRLEYLDEHDGQSSFQRPPWAEGDPFISKLNTLRPRLVALSSAESLNLIIEELDLRRSIVQWGNSEQRLANIDQLRRYALEYETACDNSHSAASLGGFLLWLNTLAAREEDDQGAAEDPQAVNVLTYHRSKGLEWPVVVCHDLENNLRADLWGISLVPSSDKVDLGDVLGGRWLRYWINPYSDQQKGTLLFERLANSVEQEQKRAEALAEEVRLLYVGITRARDYLILPSRMRRNTAWLNRVWSEGDEKIPTLDPNDHESPWDWKGEVLFKHTQTFVYPVQHPVAEPSTDATLFLPPPPAQRPVHEPYDIKSNANLKVSVSHNYSAPPSLAEGVDIDIVVHAQQAFLRAAMYLRDTPEARQVAADICQRFGLAASFDPQLLVEQGRAWWKWWQGQLANTFQHQQQLNLYAPTGTKQQQRSTVDWAFQEQQQVVLVQDSSYSGDNPKRKAQEYATDLATARAIWLGAKPQCLVQTFVHFPALGQLVALA